MPKFGIVLVSHSENITKGLKDLVDEMNDGTVPVISAGGADGGRIGTSATRIMDAIESIQDCEHILIYPDLGSSIMSAETAIDMLDDDLSSRVRIVDCPLVEGAFAGVVEATASDSVEEVIRASEDAREAHKIN